MGADDAGSALAAAATAASALVTTPRLSKIHKQFVHASASTPELKRAILAFIGPYVSRTEAPPAIRDVLLMPNARANADTGRLEGYVATVAGIAAAAGVLAPDTGLGRSWFRVTKTDATPVVDTELVTNFEPLGERYTHTGMRVSVVKGEEYPNMVHYLVVEGADREASAALLAQTTRARASLDDVVAGSLSALYTHALGAAKDAREKTAREFMTAHGFDVDGAANPSQGEMLMNYVTLSEALSEPARSSRVGAKNMYLVYSHAADPSRSTSGVLMYRGPTAGYILHTGEARNVKGRQFLSFTNAELVVADSPSVKADSTTRLFSAWPADTGVYVGAHSNRTPDRHKGTSPAMAEVHAARVKWSGAVRSYNPLGETIMHAPNDSHLIACLTRLGAPPGGKVTPLTLENVVTELAPLDTRSMTPAELLVVARRASETTLPVATARVVAMLADHGAGVETLDLKTLFSSQQLGEGGSVDVDTGLLVQLATKSASLSSSPSSSPAPLASSTTEAHDSTYVD
jgi:hypothetical protein